MESLYNIVDKLMNLSAGEITELMFILKQDYNIKVTIKECNHNRKSRTKQMYDLYLEGTAKKLQVVKAVKELFDTGLKEAKDLVDNCPIRLVTNVPVESMKEILDRIEAASGIVRVEMHNSYLIHPTPLQKTIYDGYKVEYPMYHGGNFPVWVQKALGDLQTTPKKK